MSSQTVSAPTPNRWVVAVAAVLMQLGLGAVYAWSIFRVPLSSIMARASPPLTGRSLSRSFDRLRGLCRRSVSGTAGTPPRRHDWRRGVRYRRCPGLLRPEYRRPVPNVRRHRGDRSGASLHHSDSGAPQVVPGQARLRHRHSGDGFGGGPPVTVPVAGYLVPAVGLFGTFGVLGACLHRLRRRRGLLHHEPARGLQPRRTRTLRGREQSGGGAHTRLQWGPQDVAVVRPVGHALFERDRRTLDHLRRQGYCLRKLGGATAALASIFVVVLAVANAGGRLGWATLSDYIGPRNVFLTMFLIQAVLFLLIPLVGRDVFFLLTIFSFIILTCYGGGFSTMPTFVSAYFGSETWARSTGPCLPPGGSPPSLVRWSWRSPRT